LNCPRIDIFMTAFAVYRLKYSICKTPLSKTGNTTLQQRVLISFLVLWFVKLGRWIIGYLCSVGIYRNHVQAFTNPSFLVECWMLLRWNRYVPSKRSEALTQRNNLTHQKIRNPWTRHSENLKLANHSRASINKQRKLTILELSK
jgi:hypothetical protein